VTSRERRSSRRRRPAGQRLRLEERRREDLHRHADERQRRRERRLEGVLVQRADAAADAAAVDGDEPRRVH